DDRIEQLLIRCHRAPGHRRVGQHDVVGDPERFEPAGLGRPSDARSGVGIPASVEIDGVQSEFHRVSFPITELQCAPWLRASRTGRSLSGGFARRRASAARLRWPRGSPLRGSNRVWGAGVAQPGPSHYLPVEAAVFSGLMPLFDTVSIAML